MDQKLIDIYKKLKNYKVQKLLLMLQAIELIWRRKLRQM